MITGIAALGFAGVHHAGGIAAVHHAGGIVAVINAAVAKVVHAEILKTVFCGGSIGITFGVLNAMETKK